MTTSTRVKIVLIALIGASLLLPATAAVATPSPAPTPGPETGNLTVADVIERTSRAYVEARAAARASVARQATLKVQLAAQEKRKNDLIPQVAEVARQSYRVGRIGPALMLLNSADANDFLGRATTLEQMAEYDSQKLAQLNDAIEQAALAKKLIDVEVNKQKAQEAIMAKQKADAEKALILVGGRSTGGLVAAVSPVARQSPRGKDGSWPPQSCTVDDPTTNGCITPRMLFALRETQRLGFNRFVSCYRPGGPYEHPKGRACDFSATRYGFGGDATGGDKRYGNDVAAFFVRNADRLGVLYVIWYRQIWLPATGWRSYSGAYGDPASDHTNHVHLSVL